MGPKGGVMPLPAPRCCAVLFLLLLQGAPSRPCSVPCLCRQGPRLDCSSAGLSSSTPLDLPAAVTALDLSHNDLVAMPPRGRDPTPLRRLTSLLLAHNRIASLSLCAGPPLPGSTRPCSSWAPRLRLLSLERNRLRAVPEGSSDRRSEHLVLLGLCSVILPEVDGIAAFGQSESETVEVHSSTMPRKGHKPQHGALRWLTKPVQMVQLDVGLIPSGRARRWWEGHGRFYSLWVKDWLGGGVLLQVLDLSRNRIDALRQQDLRGCGRLRELYLQHNAISSIHPLAFRDLRALQVLDLRFNALSTALPPPAYPSIQNLDARADDRVLRAVRRRMGFDRDRGRLRMRLLREEPPCLAGRDVLHLDAAEFACAVTHRDRTSYLEVSASSGADVLLPCRVQQQGPLRVYWWTPFGVTPGSDVHGGLLIRSVRVHDEGLYACASWAGQLPLSVVDVHVQEDAASARRKARDVRTGPREAERTRSEFVLAVCLSVFITFAGAFVLGAATRPLLNALWRTCTERNSGRVPKACENEGFSAEGGAQQGTRGTNSGTSRSNHPTDKPHYVTIYADYTNQCDAGSIQVLRDDAGQTYDIGYVERSERAESFSKDEDLPSRSEDTGSPAMAHHSQKGDDDDDQSHPSPRNILETLLASNVCDMDVNFTPEAVNEPDAKGISGGVQQYRRPVSADPVSPEPSSLLHSAFKGELEADWAEKTAAVEDAQGTSEIWVVCPSQPVDLSAASAIGPAQLPWSVRQEGREEAGFPPRHPTDAQDANFDPDLWDDRGESFEFNDSFQEASFRTSPQDPSEANSSTPPDTDPCASSPFEPKEKNDLGEEQDHGFNEISCYEDSLIQQACRFRRNSAVQPQKSDSLREFREFGSNSSVNADERAHCSTLGLGGQTHFLGGSDSSVSSEENSTADLWGRSPAVPQERDDVREEQNDGFNYELSFRDAFSRDTRTFKTDSAVEPQRESQTSDTCIERHESSSNSSIFEDEPPDCTLRCELKKELAGYTAGSELTEESRGYFLNADLTDKSPDHALSSYFQEGPVKLSETAEAAFHFEKPFYIHSYCSSSSARAPPDEVPAQSGRHLAEEMGEASNWGLTETASGRQTAAGGHPERSVSHSPEEPEPLAWSELALPFGLSTNFKDGQRRPEETDQQTPRWSPIPTTGPPVKPRRSFILAPQPVVADETREEVVVTPPSSPSLEKHAWFPRMSPQVRPKQDSRTEGLLLRRSRMIEAFDPFAHSSLAQGVDKGLSERDSSSRTSLHTEALDDSIPSEMTADLARETAIKRSSRDEAGNNDPCSVQGLDQHRVDTSRTDEGPDDSHFTFLSNFVEAGRNESSEA